MNLFVVKLFCLLLLTDVLSLLSWDITQLETSYKAPLFTIIKKMKQLFIRTSSFLSALLINTNTKLTLT